MKTINKSQTYQCDACKGTPVASDSIPAGWKELRVCVKSSAKKAATNKVLDFCAGCSAPNNASAAAVLSKLLE